MRFFEDGPSIPDALLERCDQGRVVFLCGAGVSIPSGMPSFVGLTKYVVDSLAPPKDSEVAKAFTPWTDDDENGPRVPLDQIFNLLHQEYGRDEVNALAAECLNRRTKPKSGREHGLIARISSDPEGRPQIVTTNFDRLFERCLKPPKRIFEPPMFPDIELGVQVHGVTYLHGRLQKPSSQNHDFILSSADFGRAYLAEGWATKFVKALLNKYTVVLIGYQAEDPPVNYLLQGLNHDGGRDRSNLYAFDKGALEDIEVKWRGRGVTPIAYSNHKSLWQTVEAWAERADNPRAWKNGVVAVAGQSPQALRPHQRGQVAHLVRSASGAMLFAQAGSPPPAEWLCVFDATCRAAKKSEGYGKDAQEFDPLETYGLDDDPERLPKHPKETDRREGPFYDQLLEWRPGDTNPSVGHSLAGRQIEGQEAIPPRLRYLLFWSSKHLNDPCLAWWAVGRQNLHPRHIEQIRRELSRDTKNLHPNAKQAWNLILEAMSDKRRSDLDGSSFEFTDRIEAEGWTPGTLRAFDEAMGPTLNYSRPTGIANTKPPEGSWDDVSMKDFIEWEVKFHDDHGRNFDVPDDVLKEVFRIAEGHLQRAAGLHHDIGTRYFHTPTCYPRRQVDGEERIDDDNYSRWFLGLIQQMSDLRPDALKSHALNWDHKDPFFFRKLKLFVLNDPQVFEAAEAADIVLQFGQDDLWDSQTKRELLFMLADRWAGFTKKQRTALVERLLAGPEKMEHWSDEDYPGIRIERAARYAKWLELQGCELTKGQSAQLSKMIGKIPEWSDGWASSIVRKSGSHSGWVTTDDDPRSLLNAPVGEIIERAKAVSGRGDFRDFTDNRPFDGLVKQQPRKTLAALSHAKRQNEYPADLWESLIEHWPEDILPPLTRLNRVFIHRLATLPHETVRAVSHPLADRLRDSLENIYTADPKLAWLVFDAVVSGLVSDEGSATESGIGETMLGSEVIRSSRRTIDHAINGPIGKITEGWVNALNSLKLRKASGIPEEFKTRLERLLAAPGEGGDHAVAIVARQIIWLHHLEPEWVLNRVMPWFDFEHPAAEPAWNGYLSAARFPPQEIGEKLKPMLLKIFPTIYQWDCDSHLAKIAAQMIVELAISRSNRPDDLNADEACQCIRNMSDESRRAAISRLRNIGQREKNGWKKHVIPFVKTVWPKEEKFKTTEMVSAWVNLLADTGDSFPAVLKSVHRFLVPAKNQSLLFRFYRKREGKKLLTAQYPQSVLEMLDAIIPDDPQSAPYVLESVLNIIKETDSNLTKDRRYHRLIDLVERR